MILSETNLKSWLELQRQLIAGLQVAYVDLHGSDLPQRGLAVLYPDRTAASEELELAARLATRSRAPVVGKVRLQAGGPHGLRVAYPLQLGTDAQGAIVVEVTGSIEEQGRIIQLLRWGETWLNLALQGANKGTGEGIGERTGEWTTAILIRDGLAQSDAADTLTAVLARLPDLTGCTRVALGLAKDDRVQMAGVSGVAEPTLRNDRLRLIEGSMREALDVGASCCWPSDDGTTSEQQALADAAALAGVCSVPVDRGLPAPLVFTFEFADAADWSGQVPQRCEDAAMLVAPLIALTQERGRGWWSRFVGLMSEGARSLIPAGLDRRLAWTIALLGIIGLGLSTGSYRISAPAVVEGAVQRAVVAPFDAFIADAPVRAGQTVAQGDLLARLDDRELQNDRRRIQAEQNELADQHRQAVATLDHAGARVVEAQLARNKAQLALLDERLARTALRAPLDGVVISGDWSRSLGAPVTRGDLLFEVAPLDHYRVAIRVSDREIDEVADGQHGELVLSASPGVPVRLRVTEIATLAVDGTAEPRFRVEAEVIGEVPQLRPGMEGIAKLTVGERRRGWIWTHPLTDWLRLQWWRWWP